MGRRILGFTQDESGDWVALLDCGHRRHVRHRPPFEDRAWVENADGRGSRVGALLECGLCDQEEPAGGETPCLADRVCHECGTLVEAGAHGCLDRRIQEGAGSPDQAGGDSP